MVADISYLKTKVDTFVMIEELNEVKKHMSDLAPTFRLDRLEK